MISKFTILYNRTVSLLSARFYFPSLTVMQRQAVITGELVEIITGATASEDM